MTTSTWVALLMIACAIADTLAMKYMLPGLLDKQPMDEKERKRIEAFLDKGIWLFFLAGVATYVFQPWG